MSYKNSKTVSSSFDESIEKVTTELQKEGFGVLTEIDVKATLKNKLDVDFTKYKILGACNPPIAYEALKAEPDIGVLLPCNVIVRETEDGKVQVSIVNPMETMTAVKNQELAGIAGQVSEKLSKVLQNL